MDKKIAVFAGSFDPFTVGHESIVKRGLEIFDEIIIAIGYNAKKKGFFSLKKREIWIKKVFAKNKNIKVKTYQGLTTEFCKQEKANFILRGLRISPDFNYERSIAQMNKKLAPEIETVFLLTPPELSPISSTIIRDIIRHGGDVASFLPKEINIYEDKI